MKKKVVSVKKLLDIIKNIPDKQFQVMFTKRRTGEKRTLKYVRYGVVTDDVKGTGRKYDAEEKNLFTIYDDVEDHYKVIGIEGIISAKIDDVEYIVKGKEYEAGLGTEKQRGIGKHFKKIL